MYYKASVNPYLALVEMQVNKNNDNLGVSCPEHVFVRSFGTSCYVQKCPQIPLMSTKGHNICQLEIEDTKRNHIGTRD
jgi:hypothetical protein